VGTSPRQFLKTVRFQNALHTKFNQKSVSLTQLACDCGYYDQSHMINDFKSLSGFTPGEYFACCEPYSDYFE
jgi:AraC-like DNA-binding protein